MEENKYKKLFDISSKIEDMLKLKKRDGILNDFHVETIPDDSKIEVIAFYNCSLKGIKTTITVSKKKRNEDSN